MKEKQEAEGEMGECEKEEGEKEEENEEQEAGREGGRRGGEDKNCGAVSLLKK